jgi:hypothetical protein
MAEATTDVTETPITETPAPSAPAADPIMDILTEGTQDPAKAEPSPAKETTPEVAESPVVETKGDDTPVPPAEPVKPAETEEPKGETEPVAETQPQSKADERKVQLNTEIRDLVSQRNALKTEVEKINSEFYQPATADQLVAQGMDPLEARITASEQRQEVADYNARVADAQLTVESESQAVLRDFPRFNPDSKEFNKNLYDQASNIFNNNLIRDENTGQVIGEHQSTYEIYKALDNAASLSTQTGQMKGQKDAETMLARADTTPGAAPKASVKDPILAILEDVDGN